MLAVVKRLTDWGQRLRYLLLVPFSSCLSRNFTPPLNRPTPLYVDLLPLAPSCALSLSPSLYPSTYIYLSIYLSIYPSIYPSTYLLWSISPNTQSKGTVSIDTAFYQTRRFTQKFVDRFNDKLYYFSRDPSSWTPTSGGRARYLLVKARTVRSIALGRPTGNRC